MIDLVVVEIEATAAGEGERRRMGGGGGRRGGEEDGNGHVCGGGKWGNEGEVENARAG